MRRSIVLALALLTAAAAAAEPRWDMVRIPAEAAAGLDLEGARPLPDGGFELVVEARQLARLRAAGYPVVVVERDLVQSFVRRNAAAVAERASTDPPRFSLGSMGGYLTLTEVVDQLDAMHAEHPDLVGERFSIGRSVEGRDIWAVKISDHPDQDEAEPEVLYTSLTHAREPSAMMAVLYYMWWLLDGYGTDPTATTLVDGREQYFVAVVNPDGYEHNRSIAPNGGGMWRKNRRFGGGVDLNRNWGFNWGYDNLGSSPSPGSDTYRGPAPFSEPETAVLRDFIIARPFVNVLHYHAHGRYYFHPYGHAENVLPPAADHARYRQVLEEMASHNGHSVGAGPELLYVVNGDAVDWTYGEQTLKPKMFGATPEVGSAVDGFWPTRDRILPIARENLMPNALWALAAAGYPDAAVARVEELTGDGDGLVDPGEELRVWLRFGVGGFGAGLTGIAVRLASDGQAAATAGEERRLAALDPGAAAELGPYTVSVAADAPAAISLPLVAVVSWEGGETRLPLELLVFGDTRVLVMEPAELDSRTGEAVLAGLAAVNVDAMLVDDVTQAPPLGAFDAVLVLLGAYPGSAVVERGGALATALEAYLAGGGAVYLEGGDAWGESVAAGGHDFAPRFGVELVANAGNGYLEGVEVVPPWRGRELVFDGLGVRLDVLAAADGGLEMLRALPQGFVCGVARRDAVTGARTVASSAQLGGLLAGSSASEVLLPLLEALGVRTRDGHPIAEPRSVDAPPAVS